MAILPWGGVTEESWISGFLDAMVPMPWWVGEKLTALGAQITNTKADASCHVDRRLVTGASPKAANAFGRLAAETLLK